MRMLGLLLLGIAIGALAAVTAVGAMKKDIPFSKASMTLMRHHFQPLRKMPEAGKCDAATIDRHLRGLQSIAGELPHFLPTGGDDAAFERHAANFAGTLDEVRTSAPADCPALTSATQKIGGACKACHDEFRG